MNDSPVTPDHPAPRHDFVSGIYNYCDRWCERCRFSERCLTFVAEQRMLEAAANGLTPDIGEIYADLLGPLPADHPGWMDPGEPTAEESARIERMMRATDALVAKSALCHAARQYRRLACSFAETLLADRHVQADPILQLAVQTIGNHAPLIAAKTRRAVHGQAQRVVDPEWDAGDDPVQSDWNGSAKVVRLAVQESLSAWDVLGQPGRAIADGVPPAMRARLAEFDAQLASQFPDAMRFIRAGFDEEADGR